MALTITPEILGQQVTSTCTYCYLFEPLRISVSESDILGEQLYIDVEIIDTTNSSNLIETLVKYAVYDINPGSSISVDLMEIAKQYHDSNVYTYSSISDITNANTGWHSMVSKYKYRFKIYSDITPLYSYVFKLPIIGGRSFPDFTPVVDRYQPLTEAALNGVGLNGRWIDYPYLQQNLNDPTVSDARPTIINTFQSVGCSSEGFVIFKSRFGGWMTWGFDIRVNNFEGSYIGNLSVGMFESTTGANGSPYVPVDYTEIGSSYGVSLKALSLLNNELRAVSGINATPAVYYMKDASGSLELMRKSMASTPVSSLSSGGDFSLSLKSISNTTQKTR